MNIIQIKVGIEQKAKKQKERSIMVLGLQASSASNPEAKETEDQKILQLIIFNYMKTLLINPYYKLYIDNPYYKLVYINQDLSQSQKEREQKNSTLNLTMSTFRYVIRGDQVVKIKNIL